MSMFKYLEHGLLFKAANQDSEITELCPKHPFETEVTTYRAVVFGIGMFAMAFAVILGEMMTGSKALMAHPNKLIYLMCMTEGAACWHGSIELIGADHFIAYFKLEEIFAATWGFG